MVTEAPKTALPVVAGILNIVSGGFKLLGFLGLFIAAFFMLAEPGWEYPISPLAIFIILGILLIVLGVLSIVGGIFALQRRHFGLALAGSIASFLPFNLLGLASIILVAMAAKEFKP
jgi:hypothetical protein